MGISDFKIGELNVNGLNSQMKQAAMKIHCDSFDVELLVLIDTRLNEESARQLENAWTSRFWIHSLGINTGNGVGRGISIGILKNSPIEILDKNEIKQGNMIMIKFSRDSRTFCLFGLYGPSSADRPGFFERLFFEMASQSCDHIVATGDFNVALNHEMDTLNYEGVRRPNARACIKEKMEEGGYIDIYREKNPTGKRFTWERWSDDKKARLDLFIINATLGRFILETECANLFESDHRLITIKIDFAKFSKGKSLWRYRTSDVSDEILHQKIYREIYNCCMRYVKVPGVKNFYEEASFGTISDFRCIPLGVLTSLDYKISMSDLLEIMLNDIKIVCTVHSMGSRGRESRELRNIKLCLLEEESKIDKDQARIRELNTEYDKTLNDILANELLKNQGSFKVEGEKPSKFFLNLEKHIISEKYIPILKEDGLNITDQSTIESKIQDYYQNLYTNRDEFLDLTDIGNYIGAEAASEIPKLSNEESAEIDGEITLDELSEVLFKTKDSSAPGFSGISYIFYKKYWDFFGPLLIEVYKESFARNKLPKTFSYGVISLIPKPGKDKTLLSNWRPITLLETGYKLLSGVLAKRINSKICKIVHSTQKGFIPGRNIVENIRLMYDTFHYAKENQKGGVALVIDYEKAFDSISHEFFCNVLSFFNFGVNMIKWIKICLSDFFASTSHASNLSAPFPISRGARQGDPLSPPIFALAIEIFSIRVRYDRNIIPFMLGSYELRISLYADDAGIFTTQNKDSIRAIIKAVMEFQRLSGLKIQMMKSIMVNFGIEGEDWSKEFGSKKADKFPYLGNIFTPLLQNMEAAIEEKIKEIEDVGKKWQYRFMTPLGRSVIAKTILYPKVIHIFSVIPVSQKVINKLEAVIYKFIWGGEKKRYVFCREDSQCRFEDGGMELLNIRSAINSYLFSWFRRALREEDGNLWRLHLDEIIKEACGKDFISLLGEGNKTWSKVQGNIRNPFWKSCFKAMHLIYNAYLSKNPASLVKAPIWNSSHFKFNNRSFNPNLLINRSMANKITFAYEFLNEDGQVLSKRDLETKIDMGISEEIYHSISVAINNYAEIPKDRYRVTSNPHIPLYAEIFSIAPKGCSAWSKLISREKTPNITRIEGKMADKFQLQIDAERWECAYKSNKELKYGNNIRWLNMQILRGALATNCFLMKSKIKTSDKCSFCGNDPETIEHLFWSCPTVNRFYQHAEQELVNMGCGTDILFAIDNPFFKELILLGDNRENVPQEIPYIINQLKRHVWVCRCRGQIPTWASFINTLKREVKIDQCLMLKYHDLLWLGELGFKVGIG